MSGTEENEYPILNSAQRCDRLFEDLLKVFLKRATNKATGQGSVYRSRELVLDYQQRLQFWAGSVGMDAGPLICVDIRLRNKPSLHGLILRLLERVEINLQRSKDYKYA